MMGRMLVTVVLAGAVAFAVAAGKEEAKKTEATAETKAKVEPKKDEPKKAEAKAKVEPKKDEPKKAEAKAEVEPKKAEPQMAATAAAAPAESAIEAERVSVCTGIVDREPEGAAESFPVSVGKVFCFSHIKGAEDSVEIEHKWYLGEDLRSAVTLPVKSSSWRTASSKRIDSTCVGAWKVEVVDAASGNVLQTAVFSIQ